MGTGRNLFFQMHCAPLGCWGQSRGNNKTSALSIFIDGYMYVRHTKPEFIIIIIIIIIVCPPAWHHMKMLFAHQVQFLARLPTRQIPLLAHKQLQCTLSLKTLFNIVEDFDVCVVWWCSD